MGIDSFSRHLNASSKLKTLDISSETQTQSVVCKTCFTWAGWGHDKHIIKLMWQLAASCSKFLGQILYDFKGMLAYRIDIKGFLAVQNSSIGDLVTH